MTTITIERAVVHRTLRALEYHTQQTRPIHNTELVIEELHAALAAPATAPAQPERKPMMDQTAHDMNLVAEKYAHKLALDLECVLADYSGTWYETAMKTLGDYRSAMNAIHERESPTFMGEPLILKDTP